MTDGQFYVLDSMGLVVVRNGLAPDVVECLNRKIDESLTGRTVTKFSVIELDDMFMELMVQPWVLLACSRLIGDGFRFDHAFGVQQPNAPPNLHGGPQACQSSCFYSGWSTGTAFAGRLSVGFVLTRQSPETGGFAYIPGSHKSSYVLHGGVVLNKLLNGNIHHECIFVPTLDPGDIVLFPDCLVHGAAPWRASYTRRAVYYMYSPGYMAWRPYDEISRYLPLAKTDLQRQLLRPPFVASFAERNMELGANEWRAANR
jgi:hypothetical protein